MAKLPLHRPIDVTCNCCRLPATLTLVSHSDHLLCGSCKMHQGDALAGRRERAHRQLMEAALAARDSSIETLREEVAAAARKLDEERTKRLEVQKQLAEGFDRIPTEDIQGWVLFPQMEKARQEKELAYRRRDSVLGRMLAISRFHRRVGVDSSKCVCGRPVEKCDIGAEIDEIANVLFRWEQKQIEYYKKGLRSALPDWHPDRSHFRNSQSA